VPGVAQTIVVCRLRTMLELGRPRKTMACPTDNLLYSYFLDATPARRPESAKMPEPTMPPITILVARRTIPQAAPISN